MALVTEELECPTCAPGTRLAASRGVIEGHVCGRCHGAFVPSHAALPFRSRLLAGKALASMQVSCPWCDAWMTWRALGDAQAAACPSCGGVWLTSSALAAETMAPPDSARRAPRRHTTLWFVAGLGAAAVLGTLLLGGGKGPAAVGAPQAVEAPAPAAAPLHAQPLRVTPPSELYAGRTATWWRDRLVALRSRGDADGRVLYDETVRRARANGLTVDGEGDALRVSEPGAATGEGSR